MLNCKDLRDDRWKSVVIIKECDCRHQFQDEQYGKGKRAHNLMQDETSARCTVCGNVKKVTLADRLT